MDQHKDTLQLIANIERDITQIMIPFSGADNTPGVRIRLTLAISTYLLRYATRTTILEFDCDESNNLPLSPYIKVNLRIKPNHCHNDTMIECKVRSSDFNRYAFTKAMKGV